MKKINQKEYEVLKELDDKWKWIARNNLYGGKLEVHTSKPIRIADSHWSNGDRSLEFLGGEHQFQFIQWEYEGSYNISELIEEYESRGTGRMIRIDRNNLLVEIKKLTDQELDNQLFYNRNILYKFKNDPVNKDKFELATILQNYLVLEKNRRDFLNEQ